MRLAARAQLADTDTDTDTDTVMIVRPEDGKPVASFALTTQVLKMCWGREKTSAGERRCLFCLTGRREIVKIVEGEEEVEEEQGEERKVTAFDEVFDVDKVEELAGKIKQDGSYSGCWERG